MSRSTLMRLVTVVLAFTPVTGLAVPARAAGAQVTGWLGTMTSGENSISVKGWVADPDSGRPTAVHVYLDGEFVIGVRADLLRPDVLKAKGYGEHSGFDFSLAADPGSHRVCVFGIDQTGDPNALLNDGCRKVQVSDSSSSGGSSGSSPIGRLGPVAVVAGGVQIWGWGLDPDTTDSISIHVYVNGKFHSGFAADSSRSDVGAIFGLGDDHGFVEDLSLYSGWHTICVYGLDKTGDKNALLDCASVAIGFDGGAVMTTSGVVLPILDTGTNSWTVYTPCTNQATVSFDDATEITDVDVVIDPGHGGSETGTAGSGLVEKTLNLDIARRVKNRLENAGYKVLLTRYFDYRLPLKTRGAIAQAVHAEAFVSIHHNGGATNLAGHPGTMTLYQHDLPESKRLGKILFQTMYSKAKQYPTFWVSNGLTGASTLLTGSGTTYLGIHRYSPDIPSVITEWGYITNPYEATQLKTSTVKNAEADAITSGIVSWFETSNAGSGDIGSWVRTTSTGTGGTGGCVDPALP
jgi:N-acetylmuramoyl-L-alanine amidase